MSRHAARAARASASASVASPKKKKKRQGKKKAAAVESTDGHAGKGSKRQRNESADGESAVRHTEVATAPNRAARRAAMKKQKVAA